MVVNMDVGHHFLPSNGSCSQPVLKISVVSLSGKTKIMNEENIMIWLSTEERKDLLCLRKKVTNQNA